ncbi:hypothetical protein [Algiphilus sp.]|uniref:hypothetical protein n=1 Tax=Algiphilus sp. TaxID=1872431 RepID=UPI0032EB1B90
MKITRDLEIKSGDSGPPSQIVGIRCDICGAERDASPQEHTPRLDIDDGTTIHRADLCLRCLTGVCQALSEHIVKMRPVTEVTKGGIRAWSYDQVDVETGAILRVGSIADEGLWSRIS